MILDGRLHRGARGLAGEIGHAIADSAGPVCTCGQRGCLEALVSGPSIARRAALALAADAAGPASESRSSLWIATAGKQPDLSVVGSKEHRSLSRELAAVASAGRPAVAVALRTPWDVALFPAEAAALCTYSIQPDSLEALAAGLAGEMPFLGRLPVVVSGLEGETAAPAGTLIAAGGAE